MYGFLEIAHVCDLIFEFSSLVWTAGERSILLAGIFAEEHSLGRTSWTGVLYHEILRLFDVL